ncbi:hypothetical protein NLU13_1113 [Sarocladium strictum]|uniref:Uncharacterized protein n=1 Tax=Sarocladium strictum TaxID=5046 RepID=A0AA39GQB6_SARSR|nr:hypothetical protein NLU13_1113 [Sarocladium strictum]
MGLKDVLWFGDDLWDPSHRFETSWLLPPWLLFACRALLSLYAFVTLFFSIGWWCTHADLGGCSSAGNSFAFFTVLTYWGLAFYFLVAAIHTGSYAATGRPLLDRFPRPLQALHSLYYTSAVTFPFVVTIVYWGVLYSNPWFSLRFDAWRNVSEHALNSGYALFEIIIPRTNPPLWINLLWLMVILLAYLGLAFVNLARTGKYVYSFLDYQEVGGRGFVAAYVVGIAVGICVVFVVVWALILLRRWVVEKKLGMDGRFAKHPGSQHDVEMNLMGPK